MRDEYENMGMIIDLKTSRSSVVWLAILMNALGAMTCDWGWLVDNKR